MGSGGFTCLPHSPSPFSLLARSSFNFMCNYTRLCLCMSIWGSLMWYTSSRIQLESGVRERIQVKQMPDCFLIFSQCEIRGTPLNEWIEAKSMGSNKRASQRARSREREYCVSFLRHSFVFISIRFVWCVDVHTKQFISWLMEWAENGRTEFLHDVRAT